MSTQAVCKLPSSPSLRETLAREGTVALNEGENLFSASEWRRLDQLTSRESVPYERITIGDADERNCVEVGRFMTDIQEPVQVNRQASDELLSIVGSPKMMRFYEEVLGIEGLCIRRCQVNVCAEGSFVGTHLDTDSNPDYLSPVVLQFSGDYAGGDYVVHHSELGPQRYRLERNAMLISRCDIPHEVTPVTHGVRKSLVFFLSRHAGKNRRWAQNGNFAVSQDMGGKAEGYWKDRCEVGNLELLYSDGKGQAQPGTFNQIIQQLQSQMPGFDARQYFDNQPHIFRDYDHLVVARLPQEDQTVGLVGARWFKDKEDGFSFLYIWTAMISEKVRGTHLVRHLLAWLMEKATQGHVAPVLLASKTYSPVAFRTFMVGMRFVPGSEGLYPDLRSPKQSPELVEQARKITRLLCPKLEVDYDLAVVREGQVGVAPDFFPEVMPLSGHAETDAYFQKHLSRRDQVLMFCTLPRELHAMLGELRALLAAK